MFVLENNPLPCVPGVPLWEQCGGKAGRRWAGHQTGPHCFGQRVSVSSQRAGGLPPAAFPRVEAVSERGPWPHYLLLLLFAHQRCHLCICGKGERHLLQNHGIPGQQGKDLPLFIVKCCVGGMSMMMCFVSMLHFTGVSNSVSHHAVSVLPAWLHSCLPSALQRDQVQVRLQTRAENTHLLCNLLQKLYHYLHFFSRRFPNWLDRWMLCRKQMGLVALGLALLHAIHTFIIPIRYSVRHKIISGVVNEVQQAGSVSSRVSTILYIETLGIESHHTNSAVSLSFSDEEQQNHPVRLWQYRGMGHRLILCAGSHGLLPLCPARTNILAFCGRHSQLERVQLHSGQSTAGNVQSFKCMCKRASVAVFTFTPLELIGQVLTVSKKRAFMIICIWSVWVFIRVIKVL